MISQCEASLLDSALESVLAAAAERPPSEDSPRTDARGFLVGLRRSFTARPNMKPLLRAVASIAIMTAISPSLSAQWPRYGTPGVPKTPDGKPDLTAPAPRTADGKPDFSGNWIRGDGQLGPAGGGTLAAPAPSFSAGPPVTTFRDVGANVKEGLPLQPWAAELVKARRATNSKDNPDAHCLPMGLMQFHNHGQPRKMIQTPGLIVIAYEANYGLRYIFTDGRTLPTADAQPWWYGYSVGRWDGD